MEVICTTKITLCKIRHPGRDTPLYNFFATTLSHRLLSNGVFIVPTKHRALSTRTSMEWNESAGYHSADPTLRSDYDDNGSSTASTVFETSDFDMDVVLDEVLASNVDSDLDSDETAYGKPMKNMSRAV